MDVQDQLLDFFRAFATAERIAIAGAVIDQPRTVPQISTATGIKEMVILRHIGLLEELGFLIADEESYRFNNDHLKTLNRNIWTSVKPQTPKLDPDSDEAVLARFVKEGKIVEFPAKRSKQLVILNWLVKQIDPEKAYPEAELSDLLMEFFPDFATLRRYMVDEGLMMRSDGVYWRTDQ